jgi:hypothetical protein
MRNLLNSIIGKKVTKKVIPLEEIIFNVVNFNIWFNHKDNLAVYAHPGIFLRLDKLSVSHIQDYLLKCYGIKSEVFPSEIIYNFMEDIRTDWMYKINQPI